MPLPEAPPPIVLPHIVGEFDAQASSGTPKRFSVLRPRCSPQTTGEIVVCAADPKRDRLVSLPSTPPETLPKAETRLSGNATLDVHGETAQISGVPSNRAMVRLKIGF